MRNLKRVLAVFVVVALMTTMMAPVFGETTTTFTYEDEFTKLYDMGLIQGIDDQGTPGLDLELTRETGIAMLVKLFVGKAKIDELEASVDNDTIFAEAEKVVQEKFSDADDISDWAVPYVAYAVTEKMVEGRTDGTLDPQGNLQGRDFATMFLRQLGYTVTGDDWSEACTLLQEKGGLTQEQAELFNTKSLIRDDMVGIAFGTLRAENSDGVRLIKALVTDGLVTEEAAVAAGFVIKDIKSVKAPADVTCTIGETPTLPTSVEATFTDNTIASVDVTWGTVDTSAEGTFDIKGTIDGFAEGTTIKVIVTGATFEVTDVTADNLKEVFVKFNRALDYTTATDKTNYAGSISPASASLQDDGKTVKLISTTTLTAYQSYNLTITNVKDANGNVIEKQTKAFTPSDVAVPQIVSVVGKGNKRIDVTFSEAVQNVSAANAANFTLDSVKLASADVESISESLVNNRTYSIKLKTPLLAGDHTLVMNQAATNAIKDYAGYNAVVSSNTFTVSNDTQIPQITKVEPVSQTLVKVTFDEEVDLTPASIGAFYWNTSGSYTDVSKSPNTVLNLDGDNTWDVTFTSNYLTAGNVNFFVKDVTDLNGNKIAGNVYAGIYKTQVTVPANTVPTVKSVTAYNDKQIDIIFTDCIDKTTATASNIKVANSSGILQSPSEVVTDEVSTSSTYLKKVSVKFTSALPGGNYTVTTNTSVKDIVGNALAASTNTISVTDTTQPASATVNYKGRNIIVTYLENMSTSGANSAADIDNYKWIAAGTSTEADMPAGSYITALSSTQYRIYIPEGVTIPAAQLKIGYFEGSTMYAVADSSGNLYTPVAISIPSTAVSSVDLSTADVVSDVRVKTANTIKMYLKSNYALSYVVSSDFEITKNNFTGTITINSASLEDNGLTVAFTVPENTFTSSDIGTSVAIRTKASNIGSRDLYDVALTASKTTANATVNDIAPNMLTFAVVDSKHILLKTDGALASGQDDALKSSIKVIQDSTTRTIDDIEQSDNGKEFLIKLASEINPESNVTIQTLGADFITAKGANNAILAANTTGITLNQLAAVELEPSNTSTAIASNDTIQIKFNRAINPASILYGFTGTSTDVTLKFVKGTSTDEDNDASTGKLMANGNVFLGTIANVTGAADISSIAAKISYDNVTRVLTITFTDAASSLQLTSNSTYTADAAITSSSGVSINTYFVTRINDVKDSISLNDISLFD